MCGSRRSRSTSSSSWFATGIRKRASRPLSIPRSNRYSTGVFPAISASSKSGRSARSGRPGASLTTVPRNDLRNEAGGALAQPLPHRGAEAGVRVEALLPGRVGLGNGPEQPHRLEHEGRLELVLELEGAGAHLGRHVVALGHQLGRPAELLVRVTVLEGDPREQGGPAHRAAGRLVERLELRERERSADRRLHHAAPPCPAKLTREGDDLLRRGGPARHRLALVPDVGRRLRGREAEGPPPPSPRARSGASRRSPRPSPRARSRPLP